MFPRTAVGPSGVGGESTEEAGLTMGGGWGEPGGEGRGVWGRVVGPGLWGTRTFWVS